MMKGTIAFRVQRDGAGWSAHCPELAGLFASGKTIDELFENMTDAANAYAHSLVKHDELSQIIRLTWEGV